MTSQMPVLAQMIRTNPKVQVRARTTTVPGIDVNAVNGGLTMSNAYLEGNFGPVAEEVTITDLEVSGTLPAALNGRYLRNGPNPVVAPDPLRYHWFTGDGMLHGLRLEDGRAGWYRNRWVRSAAVLEAMGEPVPEPLVGTFGPNTNVVAHNGRTFAIVEAGPTPFEMTAELDTVGPVDFGGTLSQGYTAHPKRDPLTGDLHAVSYYWGWGNRVDYTVLGADGRIAHRRSIDTTGSPMIHDMSLTERFAVVYDLPVAFDLDAATAGSLLPYSWTEGYPARLGLVPRLDGPDADADVRWIDIDACYVFHPMNAYDVLDADGHVSAVVLDVVRWDRMFDDGQQGLVGHPSPTLVRWTVELASGKVHQDLLDDHDLEFPRIDERLVGRRHRYGYSAVNLSGSNGSPHGGVLRHDVERGVTEVVDLGAGAGQCEAVFVPSSPGAAEDDGWLLCLTYAQDTNTSRLVVLHAQDLGGGPVAEVHLPVRVPFGFHGNWVPDA